ncbi:class E sortase [Brevibacterium sp. HMSC22B09]|uniref:class E sortase n=1 Tax=Brevibacterium sp. HMSC22B09 TaxID=1581055 RepID=UPI0008A631B6|nr:class E sortase [Brevibacterium sp. HMSC22B09]OFT97691.1 class E sortase [Brevibacterium sp. HMSC22B09]
MDQPLTRKERIARERAEAQRAEQAESAGETYAVHPEGSQRPNREPSRETEAPAESTSYPAAEDDGAATSPMPAVGERPYIRPAARDARRAYGTGPQHTTAPNQGHSAPTGYSQPAAYSAPTGHAEPAPAPPAKSTKPEPEPLGFVRGTIRGFGELCITAGLILILFVVWQLWWTDIEANKDNQHLAGSLAEKWRENPLDKLPEDPDTPVPAALPAENEAFGIMYIPRFGPNYYRTIAEGVSLEPVLNRMGMGHYPSTAKPGEVGNFAMAGHRVTYGKPLNLIAEMQPGDRIYIQTKEGVYTYTFRNYDITLPDATEVLAPVPAAPEYKGKDRIMTLTACNPMFSARERYIAYATLTDWSPAGTDVPKELADLPAFEKAGGK